MGPIMIPTIKINFLFYVVAVSQVPSQELNLIILCYPL